MKVSELAQQAGTSAKTIRFYEAEGILPPPPRQSNGYRDYDEEDLCRVRLVVALRALGLDLAESGRLASLCSTGQCDDMSAAFAARIGERRASGATAIAQLRHLDEELATLQRTLETGESQETFCLGAASRQGKGMTE